MLSWSSTFSAAQAAGSVTLLHCEDGAMLRQAGAKLMAEGRGAVANFPDARPVAAEVAAVDQAIGIARRAGARVLCERPGRGAGGARDAPDRVPAPAGRPANHDDGAS